MQTRKRSINAVEKELANDAELGITHAHHTFLDFDTQKHGKWTVAEEQRANQLVVDFENGTLQDCESGTTLRSYLARKLNCAPMRISKKFAGRCIGKVRFWHPQCVERPCSQFRYPFNTSSAHPVIVCAPGGRRVVVPATAASCDQAKEPGDDHERCVHRSGQRLRVLGPGQTAQGCGVSGEQLRGVDRIPYWSE